MQTLVVADNILSLIKGKSNMKVYKPMRWLEGSIRLTLGKVSLMNCHLSFYSKECTLIATRNIS
jgi:hypothetical protein